MKKTLNCLPKRLLCAFCALIMILQIMPAAGAVGNANAANDYMKNGSVPAREYNTILNEWKFKYMGADETTEPKAKDYNDSNWSDIQLPHTWNALDGQDGGGNYARGNGWYRRNIKWSDSYEGKRVYLKFLGANQETDTYLNGELLGTHKGGYTAFSYDITEKLNKDGDNILAVQVDNRQSQSIAPLSADYTFFGGIYREVALIVVDPIHVDLADCGSSGLYLTTSDVSDKSAALDIRSKIVNDSNAAQTVTVQAILRTPDHFDAIAEISKPIFDPAEMATNEQIKTITKELTIPANGESVFEEKVTVENPHLWNGREDPFRYQVDLNIIQEQAVIDSVSDYVGFRYFSVDSDGGFFLNGKSYPLRGVNRHQEQKDKGWALVKEDHDEDFGMIYEIGANAIRLAHYPHDPYFYDLCDRYGIVVWAEIPLINAVGTASDFNDVTKQQLREMIRQQYNRPSICFWGLQNEVGSVYDAQMKVLMSELNTLAHQEDPTGRLTTQAANHDKAQDGWASDVLAWNCYPMWYDRAWYGSGSLGLSMDSRKGKGRPVAVSEYGAGANPYQHEEDPEQPSTAGPWHPEEYQSKVHEMCVKDISTRNYIWGTFLWNMFDFASDSRKEGSQPGINDKGLVTQDRQLKKDSFYLYKANWNNWDPFTHINSSRWNPRENGVTTIRVYSNCDTVALTMNGQDLGTKTNNGYGIFEWPDIQLTEGDNTVIASGTRAGSDTVYTDTVVWNKIKGTTSELASEALSVDNNKKVIGLNTPVTAETLKDVLWGINGATYKVYLADGVTEVTEGSISAGMKLISTSEDGKETATYVFRVAHLAANQPVTSSSVQSGNPTEAAVDFKGDTRWCAGSTAYPQWIRVDLGAEYYISSVSIDWFVSGTRAYLYQIQTSTDDSNYTVALDKTNNTTYAKTTDELNGALGRYVKVNVTGSTNAGRASLYELVVNGWNMTSDEYSIDHTKRIIRIPASDTVIPDEEFIENLNITGNCEAAVVGTNHAYYVVDGESLVLTDPDGHSVSYTIMIGDKGQTLEEAKANVLAALDALTLSNELTADDILAIAGEAITDDSITIEWTNGEANGFQMTEGTPYNGNLNLAMTLKKDGNSESIAWEKKFEQPYGLISKGKPVTSSGDKSATETGNMITDDDLTTRWTAPLRFANSAGKMYYYDYPEWVMIDLEEICDLSQIELYFFNYDKNDRYYQYEVLISDTNEEDSFVKLVDMSETTDKTLHFTHDVTARARYVKINVVGNDSFNKNPTACRQAASIYEVKVYGRAAGSTEDEPITGTVKISGDAKYGETLKAVVSDDAPQNGLTYIWTCGDKTATGETYTITADDIGKAITLTVTAEGYTSSLTRVTDEVTKAQNMDKPSGVTATNCTANGSSDGKLSGITTGMEYSVDNGTTWIVGAGDDITDLAAGDYLVRYAETETHEASKSITVTIGVDGGDKPDDPKKEETPNALFDAETMRLSALEAGMKYSIDGGKTWVIADGETVDLSDLNVNAKDGILIYMPGDGETTSDSDKQEIELTQASKPVVTIDEEGNISGLNDSKTYEYRESDDDEWKTLDNPDELTVGMQIRVAGEGTMLASEAAEIKAKPAEGVSEVTGVRLNTNSAKMYINRGSDTIQLTATVEPDDAANKNVTWTSSDDSVATVDQNGLVTIHSVGDVTITATTEDGGHRDFCIVTVKKYKSHNNASSSSSSTSDTNKVTVENVDNGTVKTDVSKAGKGDTVTITVKPDAGYEVDEVIVTDKSGDEIRVTDKGNGKYTFKMPDSKVSIEVAFKPVPVTTPPVIISFADVKSGDWFAPAVSYVAANGIMNGNSGNFSPDTALSRGMIAQILYNMEGGIGTFALTYSDVSTSDWYANAVSFVSAHGIMSGYGSGLFGADDSINREQLALTLYKYAQMKNYDTSAAADLSVFVDGYTTSDWAKPAMQWAVAHGLFSGKTGNRLDPQGTASRAEVAAVLMSFCKNIAK